MSQDEKSITRRTMLSTGAGSLIAASGLLKTDRAKETREQSVKPPFDIRNHVEGAELVSADIQANYDTINRMVALIGDFPFVNLFHEPFSVLLPRIIPRLDTCSSYGILPRPEQVKELLIQLQHDYPKMSVAECFISPGPMLIR